jgi:rhodanese-related sulfurtransferase
LVVCRYGNDSQEAVKLLRENYNIEAKDLVGGLDAYSIKVDNAFPRY